MGGKTSTSTSGISIPPEVMARYTNANNMAQNAANTPFQQYSGQFVAPINAQQQTGIAGTNAAANQAQPYFTNATNTLQSAYAGAQPYNNTAEDLAASSSAPLSGQQIQQYLSPYLGTVLGSTEQLINQQNQQAQAGQTGQAIQQGAFGGDRAGIAAANLQGQQNLAAGNIYSGILNQGYQQALGTAQGQQQIGLQGAQTIAGIGNQAYSQGANTSQQMAGLGAGAQAAALQGAGAQLSAGQLQQQTQQAQDTALYNQFLQQQSYPFQTSQFLANIAEGTGALTGSTTTTQQPGGFFSDDRLKEDIEPVGETYDGQKIIRFRYKGQKDKQLGLSAQKVEHKHPDAVGLAGGYRTVDYGKATDEAAERGHFRSGGLAAANDSTMYRSAHAGGGSPQLSGLSPFDYAQLLQAQAQMYAPFSGAGLYGGAESSSPRGGSAHVPAPNVPVSHLAVADPPRQQTSALQNMNEIAGLGQKAVDLYKAYDASKSESKAKDQSQQLRKASIGDLPPEVPQDPDVVQQARGGVAGYADGGTPYDDLLQAQQQMYAPMQHRRDIPNQAQGHNQLAVVNAPAPAANNGASNVTQAVGLGEKGYKLYNHFANPSTPATPTAPAGGVAPTAVPVAPVPVAPVPVAPVPVAPVQPAGLAAGSAPAAPVADVAAPAAAEVAAPAAAEVAAPAAAEGAAGAAAGTAGTAAGSAAAGALGAGAAEVGGTAAADAAAALAAEYAAAVAAAAVAAAKRGGRIHRKFAAGGIPYEGDGAGTPYQESGGTMDIPDTEKTPELKKAGPIQKQPTGLQSLMTMGDPNKASGLWGSVFSNQALARGGLAGRHAYATDGAIDDTADSNPAEDAGNFIGRHLPSWDQVKSALAGAPRKALEAIPGGSIVEQVPGLAKGIYAGATAPPRAPDAPAAVDQTIAAPAPASKPIRRAAPKIAPAAATPVAPPQAPAVVDENSMPPVVPKPETPWSEGEPTAAPSKADAKSSIWDKVQHVLSGVGDSKLTKAENLIPLLTGIAAMGTAPTRSLGVALASGLGAGAQSYLPTQQKQADIAQTQAQTGAIGAGEWATIQKVAGNQNMLAVPGPATTGGKSFTTSDGKTYHFVPKGELYSSGTGAPENTAPVYKYIGNQGKTAAESDYHRLIMSGATEGEAAASKVAESNVSEGATNAYSQGGTLNQLTTELEKIPANGVVSSGPMSPWRSAMVNRANDLIRTIAPSIGVDPGQYLISPEEAGDVTAANKLGGFFRLAATKNADQRSLGALEETATMIPSPQIPRDQAAKVLSGMYVDKQRALDEYNYVQEYKKYLAQAHPGMSQNYLVQNARESFRQDHPDTEYGAAKAGLNKLLTTTYKDGRSIFPDFYSGKLKPEFADRLTGVPGISRMFLNR